METNTNPAFTLEGRMPFGKAFPIGLQHVLAMFVANITPIMILTGICNLEPTLKANLVQNAMIIAGIGTLIKSPFVIALLSRWRKSSDRSLVS